MNPESPATRQRDDTRQKILDAALELFAAQGFDATTVREIAQQVGITDAALYYHFKSKREILTSLWSSPFGDEDWVAPPGALDIQRLDELTELAINFTVANDHLLRLTNREALGGDQTAVALRLRNRAYLRRALQEHFGTVCDPEEADIRSEAVLALVTGTTMRGQIESGPNYQSVATSPEFLERTRRWVRAIARLEEAEAS